MTASAQTIAAPVGTSDAEAREEEDSSAATGGDTGWFFGPRLRNRGAVHSDFWEGTAADLPRATPSPSIPRAVGGAKSRRCSGQTGMFDTRSSSACVRRFRSTCIRRLKQPSEFQSKLKCSAQRMVHTVHRRCSARRAGRWQRSALGSQPRSHRKCPMTGFGATASLAGRRVMVRYPPLSRLSHYQCYVRRDCRPAPIGQMACSDFGRPSVSMLTYAYLSRRSHYRSRTRRLAASKLPR
jgi:hypothetical protein